MKATYIINGKIVLPDAVLTGKALAYDADEGRIIGVVDTLPENAETIDANGGYVAPGLVDIHIHGYLGEDTSDAKPEGIKKMAYGVAKNGVTAFLPTTMTVSMDEINAALDAVRSLKEEGYGVILTTHNPDHALLLQDQVAILDRDGVLATGLSTDVLKEQNLSELYGTELKLFYEERLGREVCAAPQFMI